jgi:RNA exonuclease 4
VCSYFLQGRCTNGAACRFSHDRSLVSPAQSGAAKRRAAAAKALAEQDAEERPWAKVAGEALLFSIDVECVATGAGHLDRAVGRIAMVDREERCVFDVIVDPVKSGHRVASYLTRLTGLTKEQCDGGVELEEAVGKLKEALPKSAVLVGQGIEHDIEWCKLAPGVDFASFVNIADIFKTRLPPRLDAAGDPSPPDQPPRYRFFSLRHTCQQLLSVDMQSADHDPIADAAYSLRLFLRYRDMEGIGLRAVRDSIARAPPTPSFAEACPLIDGVVMGRGAYQAKWKARLLLKWMRGNRERAGKKR